MVPKDSSGKKVFFYETYKTFYRTFGKGMSMSAQFRFKSDGIHKYFIIMIPNRVAFYIPAGHNTLHVVCRYVLRNTHAFKCVDLIYKQIFLFGIRKELYIALTAMMANHCKTGYLIRIIIPCICIYKAPVHLIIFTSIAGITPATILSVMPLPVF